MMNDEEEAVDALVGQRVRGRRVELAISQTQLAQAIGVTFQQVQKYERGTNRISASKLWLIGRFLKVPPAYFLAGLPDIDEASSREMDAAKEDRAELLAAFSRISDPRRRRTVIEVAEGLGDRSSRRARSG